MRGKGRKTGLIGGVSGLAKIAGLAPEPRRLQQRVRIYVQYPTVVQQIVTYECLSES
jgi:hypothetical protein